MSETRRPDPEARYIAVESFIWYRTGTGEPTMTILKGQAERGTHAAVAKFFDTHWVLDEDDATSREIRDLLRAQAASTVQPASDVPVNVESQPAIPPALRPGRQPWTDEQVAEHWAAAEAATPDPRTRDRVAANFRNRKGALYDDQKSVLKLLREHRPKPEG